ncbi:MAG: hypothetical protein WC459_02225 [Patescibacteria group bacterium]
MFAKIIPFAKLPRKFKYFDYSIPQNIEEEIKIGHIVAIYFHTQKIYGIVEEISEFATINPEKIKPIYSLTNIVLPEYFRNLIHWAGKYYLTAPALLYRFFVPKNVSKKGVETIDNYKKELVLSKEQAERIISALQKINAEGKFFFYENDPLESIAVFIKLAQKEVEKGKQVLILVPAIEDINTIAPYLNSIFKNDLLTWKGKVSAGEKFLRWKKIIDGEAKIILGTRPSIFLPFKDLSLICIYNATSADHKQWDMNPRYDARIVAEKIQEYLRVKIVFSDVLPDVKIWDEINSGKVKSLNSPVSPPEYSLVDLKQERSACPVWSFPLYNMISEAQKTKERCILFLNRRETDSLLACEDCRQIALCPVCRRPYSVDNDKLLCYHCIIENPINGTCIKCGGSRLKPLIPGISAIKKIIRAEFPGIKIETINKGWHENLGEFDVLITTDYFWKNIFPFLRREGKIYGAAILDFDFYLSRPEWNQAEIAAFALYRFFKFIKIFGSKSSIIQTSCPENPIFGNFNEYYGKELDDRKALEYPPFSRLIKIICKDSDKIELENGTKNLYNNLIKAGFLPLPPFDPYNKKRSKNYLKHIILKESTEKSLEDLKKIVPDNYQIDIDPVSIY